MLEATQYERLAAQVFVLNAAVSSIAAASNSPSAILAYFEPLSELMMSQLVYTQASDTFQRSVLDKMDDFRQILLSGRNVQTDIPN
ncbi:hypothetical protein F6R98_03515 [Candidatus Methylospira mobilis]|uniref:Uncharacterized protein n=1 Tax=Candidatus Methylospira mobilis TaxID=1808979 RepID=A0A5Q0BDD1_9GAMM|nr:hypothetical protein [Candidatus Methylospira mobilis]QFY41810.1 hypothetical protein F6R98_03515 [Candidatus Methylospira mobilis]WNV06675.1 hypothetical protein RP726_09780 [Candidatus Methylospira mobilis]